MSLEKQTKLKIKENNKASKLDKKSSNYVKAYYDESLNGSKNQISINSFQ